MLRFIHISDTHIGPDADYTRYGRNTAAETKRLIDHINALPFEVDFVVHTGDMAATAREDETQHAAQLFSKLKAPIYYVVGNHDSPRFVRQHLRDEEAKGGPLYYDFIIKDYHCLVLDTRGDIDPQGYVNQEQLDWLAQKCAASTARSLVVFLHHLPMQLGVKWYDQRMRITNDADLFRILRPHREQLCGVFFGHIHRTFTGFRDGILCSAAASSFGQLNTWPSETEPTIDPATPGGFALVRLMHEQTTITHHTIPGAPVITTEKLSLSVKD